MNMLICVERKWRSARCYRRVCNSGTLLSNKDYDNALEFPRKTGTPISVRESIKTAALTMAHNYSGLVESVISKGIDARLILLKGGNSAQRRRARNTLRMAGHPRYHDGDL